MIRLNIKKDSKVVVKSFIEKKEVRHFIREELWDMTKASDNPNAKETAEKIWNLNVGTSINVLGYTIAMAGKSRAGNIMLGGK